MLFDVQPRGATLHLRPRGEGSYELIYRTSTGASVDLLDERRDWCSALERFLRSQEEYGVSGTITSATGVELSDVLRYSVPGERYENGRRLPHLELYEDRSQPPLFGSSPVGWNVRIIDEGGSHDLLTESAPYLIAYDTMLKAHEATGLETWVSDIAGNVRAFEKKERF